MSQTLPYQSTVSLDGSLRGAVYLLIRANGSKGFETEATIWNSIFPTTPFPAQGINKNALAAFFYLEQVRRLSPLYVRHTPQHNTNETVVTLSRCTSLLREGCQLSSLTLFEPSLPPERLATQQQSIDIVSLIQKESANALLTSGQIDTSIFAPLLS